MKKFLVVVAVLAMATCSADAQQKKFPKVIYHGHSFFEIHSSKGTVVIMDPHEILTYGRPLKLVADLALLSHPHNDHTQYKIVTNKKDRKLEVIKGWKVETAGTRKKFVWNNIGKKKVKDVEIRTFGAYHDTRQGLDRGINTIFLAKIDGWVFAHCGDLGHTLSKRQLKQLAKIEKDIGRIDVLMIPVGGVYTINGSDALKVVKQIRPREYIIPMHYATPVFDELLGPTEFLDGFTARRVKNLKTNLFVPDKSNPNRPRPFVVKMHYWRKVKSSK